VGKGFECGLGDELGSAVEEAVRKALTKGRGSRNGRFWVSLKKRIVMMLVGASFENRHHRESF
jgi:hypothetical protein